MGSLESRGLPTLINWCYVSSIFQAFLHAPKFVEWLKEQHHGCEADLCLVCAFRDLSSTYWQDLFDEQSFRLAHRDLKRALKKSPTFKALDWKWKKQNDAPEFFSELLNALRAEDPELEWVLDGFFRCDYHFLKSCPRCKNEIKSPDSSLLLQVKFKKGAPLENILKDVTFGLDTIPDRRCEACSSCSDTGSVCQLVLGPDILVIHLVRFTDGSDSESRKNTAVIPFKEELDLSPFTEGKFFLKYRLLSVVQHRGTREKGHYITIARAPSGAWMRLDDVDASPATGTDPFCPQDEDDEDDEGPFTPYVLFWAKVDENEMKEPPTEVHTASTNADNDDELRPVQITVNSILQPPSKNHFVRKTELAKPKQQHQKDENEDGLRPLQISINGIQQPPSGKHSVNESFSTILNQQDVEEIYENISKILSASETKEMKKKEEMGEGKKNELEKAKSSIVNGEVEEGDKAKESPRMKDGKDGNGDEDEDEEGDEDEEKHEEEQQQQQDEQEEQEEVEQPQEQPQEQEQEQEQEKHEEKNETEQKEHEKISSNKRQRPDDHGTSEPEKDNFPKRQKSPNNSTSSPYPRKGGNSEEQTPSDDEAPKEVEPKRAQVGKKRRRRKRKNW